MIYVSKKKRRAELAKMNFFARVFALWGDNLKAWKWYLEENNSDSPLNLQKGFKKLMETLGIRQQKVSRDMRHQVQANVRERFPEGDGFFSEFLLFIGGSIPRFGDYLKESRHKRHKKQIQRERKLRAQFETVRLHPLQFLGGTLAVVGIAVLCSLYSIGTTVHYRDTNLGIVSNRITIHSVINALEKNSKKALNDDSYELDTAHISMLTNIVPRKEVESKEEFSEALSSAIGDVAYAYVLYIDDEPIAATTYAGALEELLEQLKAGYISEDTVDCYFKEKTEIRQEYVDSSFVMNLGYIAEILNETKSGEINYTVVSGDAPLGIAEQFGLTLEQLEALNPGYNFSVLHVNDVLTISNAVPYLTIVNVERQDYISDVPYDVEYELFDDMYQGDYKVLSSGVYGKADISANVTYINGEEITREIVSTVTLLEPVTELQATGTMPRPSWFPTGSFRWPCSGVLTSRFGGRNTGFRGASTYHEGIDIGASYGSPVYAADGGTVSYSGWLGGLGYCVKIDHGNGYVTTYGHNSGLCCSVGDHVYKGEQIARVGSTGVSSGNHCHFGIQLNGTYVNPLNYLSY